MVEFVLDLLLFSVPGLFWAILAGLVAGTIIGIAAFSAFLALAVVLKTRGASRASARTEQPD